MLSDAVLTVTRRFKGRFRGQRQVEYHVLRERAGFRIHFFKGFSGFAYGLIALAPLGWMSLAILALEMPQELHACAQKASCSMGKAVSAARRWL